MYYKCSDIIKVAKTSHIHAAHDVLSFHKQTTLPGNIHLVKLLMEEFVIKICVCRTLPLKGNYW
jgi:hypothetical protein